MEKLKNFFKRIGQKIKSQPFMFAFSITATILLCFIIVCGTIMTPKNNTANADINQPGYIYPPYFTPTSSFRIPNGKDPDNPQAPNGETIEFLIKDMKLEIGEYYESQNKVFFSWKDQGEPYTKIKNVTKIGAVILNDYSIYKTMISATLYENSIRLVTIEIGIKDNYEITTTFDLAEVEVINFSVLQQYIPNGDFQGFYQLALYYSATYNNALYQDGYGKGKEEGEEIGYKNGFIAGREQQLKNPVSYMLQPVAEILNTNLFGNFSIGAALSVALFVGIVIIFIKMFAGG